MRFRHFIFDFDGTLADSAPWMAKALNRAAARFGFRQVSDEEIEALRGLDNRAIIKALGVPMWRLPAIARYIKAEVQAAESPPLFDGVPEMLRRLRQADATLAVVSSNSEAAIRRALGENAALFQAYACDASLFGKAAKFKRVLRACALTPAHAIAIGDEARDIEAARAAGIACGAVTWGYATRALLEAEGADVMFDTPADIAALVA